MNEDKQNYFKVIEGTTLYYEHYVKYLQKQLEAYENMRKEALKHKNEIKKILDKLNSSQWKKDEEEIFYKILFSEEFYKLLNYIDNLENILNKVGDDKATCQEKK